MIILSIIVPCYNSERFVANTIEMLLQQDFSSCELILVNDGSTDNTLSILRKYESFEDSIFVIDQPNQGVSVARNTGLFSAKGKYIYFLDSDDTLTDGSLDYFKQTITQHPDCRMFAFGYEARRNGRRVKSYVFHSFDTQEMSGWILTRNFLNKKLRVNICSSIYERHFLLDHGFCFRKGVKIGEDLLFFLQVMMKEEKVYYSARFSFVYQLRDDSLMQGYRSYSKEYYNNLIYLRELLIPIAAKNKSIRKHINFFLSLFYLLNLRYYLRSDMKSKEINALFIADGRIRYKRNYSGNIVYWLLLKLSMFIPVKMILKIWK